MKGVRDAVARVLALRRDDGPVDGLPVAAESRVHAVSTTPLGPRYTVHDGFRMPMGFPVAGLRVGAALPRAQPATSSSPRIRSAARPGRSTSSTCSRTTVAPLAAGQSLDDVFPHLEEVGEEPVRALPEPRLIKTHLPFARTPWSAQAKYIYVARNPFDCAVSFYHHTRGFVRHYDFADGVLGHVLRVLRARRGRLRRLLRPSGVVVAAPSGGRTCCS